MRKKPTLRKMIELCRRHPIFGWLWNLIPPIYLITALILMNVDTSQVVVGGALLGFIITFGVWGAICGRLKKTIRQMNSET